ncbi:deaminase domain-containing protein [Nocardiopsis rhodophaea]|uniref:deaminase domain-containing protein n=1 Tax=Nocardiopsis rhodophaea TaxID=280238 RepID=UPI0031D29CFC
MVVVLAVAILAALMSSGIIGTVTSGVQSAAQDLFRGPSTDGGPPSEGSEGGSPGNQGGRSGSDGGSSSGSNTDDPSDSSSRPDADKSENEGDDGRGSSDGSEAEEDKGSGGNGQGGGTQAAPSGGSDGFLDDLLDKGDRALQGAGKAAENAVDDGIEDIKDAKESVENLIDDPVKWGSDQKEKLEQTAKDVEDRAKNDPTGLARDFFASDEAQQKWRNGDKAGAAGMVFVENAEGLIPIWGWNKKKERLDELAEAANKDKGNKSSDNDGEPSQSSDSQLADGEHHSGGLPPKGSDGKEQENGKNDDNEVGCSVNSFVPGTPVLRGDGSRAPIEDIAVGDEVWAFDPLTGGEGPRPVTDVISGEGTKTLVDITFAGEDGGSGSVTATDHHPFWVPQTGEWVDAVDLEPGVWLRTSAGTWVQITAVDARTVADQQAHNLTVEGFHTYYVGAGSRNVLSHNENDCYAGDTAGAKKIRDDKNIGWRKNVAIVDYDIDDAGQGQKIGVSGKNSPEGTSPAPDDGKRQFNAESKDGSHKAPLDSEAKALEDLSQHLNESSRGRIDIYTERPPCTSCQNVIDQFVDKYPNVDVRVTWGENERVYVDTSDDYVDPDYEKYNDQGWADDQLPDHIRRKKKN